MLRNSSRKTALVFFIAITLLLLGNAIHFADAQQPQIPSLQVCNQTKASGKAVVTIIGRQDATHTGVQLSKTLLVSSVLRGAEEGKFQA